MSTSFDRELEILIDGFHAQERLRIWSLVITIFGDAVLPRGGEVWLGSLQELMQRMRVEPNALRAAMSRLTADGWLIRLKVGRKSFYRLAAAGEAEFADGTEKIYTPQYTLDGEQWTIIVLTGEAGNQRDARRAALRSAGFGSLSPTVFVRPGRVSQADPDSGEGELVFESRLCNGDAPSTLIANAWPMETIAASYLRLIDRFSPLADALKRGSEPDPLSAMAARSLLIHEFRRTALRDPHFPRQLRPPHWHGDAARQLISGIYRYLAGPSEGWLDGCLNAAGMPLARPGFDVGQRFGKQLESA